MGRHLVWDKDVEILCLMADKANLWKAIYQLDNQAKLFRKMIDVRDRQIEKQETLISKLREIIVKQDGQLKGSYVNQPVDEAPLPSGTR